MLTAIGVLWSLAAESKRATFIGHVLVAIAGVLAALALALGLRPLINGIYARDLGETAVGGIVCLAAIIVLVFSPLAQRAFEARNIEMMIKAAEQRILRLTAGAPGLSQFEDPANWDRLQVLQRSFTDLLMGTFGVFVLPVVAAELIIATVVLATLAPVLLVLPLIVVPVVWLQGWAQRIALAADQDSAADTRVGASLFILATSPRPAAEIRVYGLAGTLLALHARFTGRASRRKERAAAAALAVRASGNLLLAAAYTAAVVTVLRSALAGHRSPGDVALTLSLAGVLVGAAAVSSQFSAVIARAVAVARNYRDLADEFRPTGPPSAAGPVAPPMHLTEGIRLTDVSFRYPAGSLALSGISAALPAGSVVALVGENGAGKTTLVKLLTRMYEPDSGQILLDGRDISGYDLDAYRRQLTASFQDYVRFELRAGRSVGVGDLARLDDEAAVQAAIAGARAAFAAELPQGLATQLGSDWEGGVELSGGQWQKLAIARAMMRDKALLTVFDEPTAALDPQSEYQIFQQVAGHSRASRAHGHITLLVSHRFSTVRMADLILVLAGGTLVEQGSHAELMTARGLYAELYTLQARAYAT
ncbi:MAG TPA: ATP-binding cassette domain-containing protein [Streptosporangiaceae bacterium]